MKDLRRRQQGLSLIEVVIATGITAVIATVIAATLQTTVRLHAHSSGDQAASEMIDRGHKTLKRFIEQSIVPDASDKWRYVGRSSAYAFTTVDTFTESPAQYELRVVKDGDGRDNRANYEGGTRTDKSNKAHSLALSPIDAADSSVVILERLSSATFAYKGNNAPSWQTSWSAKEPPALIQLAGETMSGEAFHMEFHPAGRTVHRCAFDPVSRRCR